MIVSYERALICWMTLLGKVLQFSQDLKFFLDECDAVSKSDQYHGTIRKTGNLIRSLFLVS